MIRGPEAEIFNQGQEGDDKGPNFGHFFTKMRYCWRTFRILFFNYELSYFTLILACTIIGLYYSEITYSLMLFDIVLIYPTL